MNMKKIFTKENVMPVAVLLCICLVVAILMGAVNIITAPKIEEAKQEAANAALKIVLPDGKNFKKAELTDEYPDAITAAYTADGGYVFEATVSGNKPGIVVMCGVSSDGKIVGVEIISDNETPSYKSKVFPFVTGSDGKYNGASGSTLSLYPVSGATKSNRAVYDAVRAALNAYAVLTGGEVNEPDDEPTDTPDVPDTVTPVITRTPEEVLDLAKNMYSESDVALEEQYVYQPDPTTVKVFKNSEDNTYVLYLATRTQYTPLETEALVKTDADGTVLKINLLTWTVGHGVEYTTEYLNSFVGKNKYSTDEIVLVSTATATSNNLVIALESALRDVFGNVAMTDAEILSFAKKAAPGGVTLEKMELPENAPETVKAMFKLSGGRGYVFYTVTSTQYVKYETEAFIYTDINGTVKDVLLATWTVGHGVEATDDFINSFNGKNADTLGEVELISGATVTSDNLVKAVSDAVSVVPTHVNYAAISIAVIAVCAALAIAAAVYFRIIIRRKRNEK